MKNRRQILSWCLYDFANSSYSAVITAVIFPVYFVKVIAEDPATGDLWWGRAVSLSMLVVAVTSPVLGGISDHAGLRKRLFVAYSLVCVVSVGFLAFVGEGMVFEAFLLVIVANAAMEGALVFYNAYLPDIAPKDQLGRVSGWGFGLGYAGSVLALLLALLLMRNGAIRLSWPMVSVFFLVFSLPAFRFLPRDRPSGRPGRAALVGLKSTLRLLAEVLRTRRVRRFLLAYWLYKDGVNTIIIFSSIYASVTLGFTGSELVILYLLVQVSAMAGSVALSAPTDRWGAKSVVVLSLLLWIAVTVSAYLVDDKGAFWAIATMAGLGLGSVQAASRALFSGFIPHGKEGEYFGIYALAGKTSAVIGPALFGMISSAAGSQRPAVLSVLVLFVLGLAVLSSVETG
ncbi:MAG TPA: MFS transporter [Nitrospirae bacterium]|nr:MFS transporter [Nitrospirota bacterium]